MQAMPDILAFQDESGDFGHGEWVSLGVLWVQREDVESLGAALRALRADRAGEVHFYRFPRNFGGDYGAAARTAQAWFERWRDTWARRTWFSVLAINRRHLRYDRARYARPADAYPHFAAWAVRRGLAAFFGEHEAIRFEMVCDARSGDGGDGAEASVLSRLAAAIDNAISDAASHGDAAPRLAPTDVAVRSSGAHAAGGLFSAEQELLQLTDLLLGAVSTAIFPRTVAATKLWFAREMARVIQSARQSARPDAPDVRGRVLVDYYPDPRGRLYRDGPLGIWDS